MYKTLKKHKKNKKEVTWESMNIYIPTYKYEFKIKIKKNAEKYKI